MPRCCLHGERQIISGAFGINIRCFISLISNVKPVNTYCSSKIVTVKSGTFCLSRVIHTFLNFLQPISSNLFTAIGTPQKGAFLSLTRQILFLLPLVILLPRFMGIDGIMYAAPIADFTAAAVAALMVRQEMKLMRAQAQ